MAGEAERTGLNNEEDVIALLKELPEMRDEKAMRILIDTNVLISAALNPNSTPFQAYVKASSLSQSRFNL